jgi:hypothetical protein
MDEQLAKTIFDELRKRLTKRLGQHHNAALGYLDVDELKNARFETLRADGLREALNELEAEYQRWKEAVDA